MHRTTPLRFRLFILFVTLAGLLTAPAGAHAAAPKKNVLFLIADDLNTMLGAYGDPLARTPNIDKLAARGVRFDRAYCTYPLCGPSRNSMLTGLHANSTGIHNNSQIFRETIPNQLSLPQAFRQQGYFAGRIGKLYHYNVPNSVGTSGHDDPASWELQLNPAGVDRTEEHPKITTLTPGQFGGTLSWYASPKSDEHHTDAMLAADAEWVLERSAKPNQRPFFLAVGFFRPHTPYVAPKDPYFGYYPREKMRIVPDIKADQADIPAAGLASYKREQDNMTDDQRRKALQAYYASITFMDAQVGRVIDALDRLGLAESTIIVFTSDHGYLTGEHGLWQKQSLFEESARVPLLIVAPGVSKAKTAAASPVSQLDLFPTLAELAGIAAPANLQGQSLVPMLRDPSVTGRGWALTQMMRGGGGGAGKGKAKAATAKAETGGGRFSGYSLRTPRWRYTEWDEGKKGRELYDHDTDPRELANLATLPAHTATVAALSTQLQAAVKTTFPPSGKAPEFINSTWPPILVAP
jgi:arylsulfatase A-like enzyme